MNNFFSSLFSKIVPQIILTIAVGSTIATGAAAGMKTIKANASEKTVDIQQVQPISPVENEMQAKKTASSPTSITTVAPVRIQQSPKPLAIAATPTAKTGNNTSQCLITLFGSLYDITSLRKSHPGGDVFVCGTDQSSTYQKTHGTNMSRMQPYLVTNSTGGITSSTGTTGATGTMGNSSSFQNDEDEESEEEQARYEDHKEEEESEREDEEEE